MSEMKSLPGPLPGDGVRVAPPRVPVWAARPVYRRDYKSYILWLCTAVGFIVPRMFHTIEAGEVGVVFHRWGGTDVAPRTERVEGVRVTAPWDTMEIYELRLQRSIEEVKVLSREGLEVRIQVTILHRPIKEEIGLLHRDIGPHYVNRVVRPEAQSILRMLSSRRSAEEIYTSQRDLQEDALEGARRALAPMHVSVEALLVTEVMLPETVQRAIDEKQRQAQVAEEYDFRVVQAEKEATRKAIEAQGLKDFKDTAFDGQTEAFLRWRTIEATSDLARSPSSRLVLLGGESSKAPLVLNVPGAGPDAAGALPAAAATSAPASTPPSAPSGTASAAGSGSYSKTEPSPE